MIVIHDISAFNKAAEKFHKKWTKDQNSEMPTDQMLILHIGAFSTIIGVVLLVLGCVAGSPFKEGGFWNSLFLILDIVLIKYFLGGFGGSSYIVTTLKLLLSLVCLILFALFPIAMSDQFYLRIDWIGNDKISFFLIMSYLLLAGALLGWILGSYTKEKTKGDEGSGAFTYNRFTAGLNAGGFIAFSVLFLAASTNDTSESSPNTFKDEIKTTSSVGASSSESMQTVAEVASLSDESVTREAEIELLRIYRPNSDVALDGHFNNLDGSRTPYYSENLKNRFKEEGITKGVDNPYSRSFVQLLERVSETEEKSDNLILDSDLLHMGQGDVMNLDLRIVSVEKKDNDNVEVKADFTNGETHRRIYVLKREEGVFKIDDFIDNGESVRKWLNDEIKSHNAAISAEGTNGTIDNWQLVGTVGDYSVVFYLDSSNNEIKGKYAYKSTLSKYGDIPANYFYLSGSFSSDNKITLFSHQYNKDEAFEKMDLTINNQNSGISLSGTLHNMNNGDQYSIELKSR